MEVSYTLTAEDLRAYLEWSVTQPAVVPVLRRVRVLGTLVFIVLAAVFALSAASAGAPVLYIGAGMMLVGAVIGWFVLPVRMRSLTVSRDITAMTAGKTGYVLGSRTAKIDENGFALLGPGLLASYTWDLVDHVGVGTGVYIFLGVQQAHIVPASAFADGVEMRRFAEAAEGYLRANATAAAL